jgi:hypothetical protein
MREDPQPLQEDHNQYALDADWFAVLAREGNKVRLTAILSIQNVTFSV